MEPTRVVILGGGFAGVSVAKSLQRSCERFGLHVTVVSQENYSLFTPMLPEVATGSIETRHIVQPLRATLKRCAVAMGEVRAIHLERKEVVVAREHAGDMTLPYDHLVLALGSESTTFGLPGIERYAFRLKNLTDAAKLRNRIIEMLESAAVARTDEERNRLLTFVIVGGGFTGVETAGELRGFLRSITRFYANLEARHMRVVLVEGTRELLPQLPVRFGRRAGRILARRGVEVYMGDLVAQLDESVLSLQSGKRFETKTVIWSAGVKPSPLVTTLPLKTSSQGAVVVNGDFSVPGRPSLWALGDCAQIPRPDVGYYAPTAQGAIRQGPVLARNILLALRGRPTMRFRFKPLGMMASLGNREGLAELRGGLMLSGFVAWFLWRTYYLSRLPGFDRKARVALDWSLDMLFPRDIARLRS